MSSIEFADNKPLTEDEIHQAAKRELSANSAYADDELRQNWINAYKYYKGEAPLPTTAQTSTVISTDVSDTIEWILPAIIKPLVESPDVVRFDPVNPEDQDQADAESDFVHHTFMKKCDGFEKLYVHIKDALLLKNGIFATYQDEGVRNQVEPYENLTEYELGDLLSPADDSRVVLLSSEEHEEAVKDPLTGNDMPPPMDPRTGQPAGPAPTDTLYDVKVRRYTPNGVLVVENCAPESFRVRMTHDSVNLNDARYCSYSLVKTRAELYAMKYDRDVVDEISSGSRRQYDNEVRWSREDVEQEHNSMDGDRNETGDPSQDPIDVHRVYMTLDTDGDGHEERQMIILAGSSGEVMLDHYEVPENPFSASTPFIAGHKFYGYSVYDKLVNLTKHKTKVLRMLEDNLDLVNNPRKKVVRGQADLDDILLDGVGQLWRVDTPEAVEVIPTDNISQAAFSMLEYYDKMRSERTGVDPNAQSASGMMPEESMNHAMERVLSMKEELIGLMIRVFAETGVKDMFLKIRSNLMRHYPREELVQLRNKWTTINPGNWVERTNTTVVVGLGTGDRIKKSAALGQVYTMQKEVVGMGLMGAMVSPERMAHTQMEFVRVSGLGDPDDFWLDPALLDPQNPNSQSPRGQEAQRALQMQQEQQQAAQQQEQAAQQAQAQSQQALLDLQHTVAKVQSQTKLMEAQIKASGEDKDRQTQMMQFIQEERRKWAELAAKESIEETKVAANTATTLIQQGVSMEQAQEASNSAQQGKGNGENT